MEKIGGLCEKIEKSFEATTVKPTDTLITKIILGVFGVFPALDTNVTNALKEIEGKRRRERVFSFYQEHKDVLKEKNIPVKLFSGEDSNMKYPIARLIDMCYSLMVKKVINN